MKITHRYKSGQIVVNKYSGQILMIIGVSEVKLLRAGEAESPLSVEYKCKKIQGDVIEEVYNKEGNLIPLNDAVKQLKEAI